MDKNSQRHLSRIKGKKAFYMYIYRTMQGHEQEQGKKAFYMFPQTQGHEQEYRTQKAFYMFPHDAYKDKTKSAK